MLFSIWRSQYLFLKQSLLFSTVTFNEAPVCPAERSRITYGKGGGGMDIFWNHTMQIMRYLLAVLPSKWAWERVDV